MTAVPSTWHNEQEHRRILANGVNQALDSPAFVATDVPQTIESGQSEVEVDLLEDTAYRVSLWEVLPATDAVEMRFQFYESGAYVTSGYMSECGPITTTPSSSSATTYIQISNAAGNASGEGWRRVEILIHNANASAYQSMVRGDVYRLNAGGTVRVDAAYGHRTSAVAATKCKIYPSSGNFASGYYQIESRPINRTR